MPETSAAASPLWRRILRFPLARLVLLGAPLFLLMGVNNGFMLKFKDAPLLAIAVTIAMAAVALALYAGFARFGEGRPASELSLSGAGREWAMGAVIGAGLYAACVLILMALGMYRVVGLNPWTYVIPAVAME